jgi:SHS2 domain-containing protein
LGGSVYRWLDHTAELELELVAATEREVLSDALAALRELLKSEQNEGSDTTSTRLDDRAARPANRLERRAVHATAGDHPALLAAWLEELVFLSESEGFIPLRIEQLSLQARALSAIVAGRIGEPRPLVKAVTYHRLEFAPSGRGYRARVVFDV